MLKQSKHWKHEGTIDYMRGTIFQKNPQIDPKTLQAKIARGVAEFEHGKAIAISEGESMEGFITSK